MKTATSCAALSFSPLPALMAAFPRLMAIPFPGRMCWAVATSPVYIPDRSMAQLCLTSSWSPLSNLAPCSGLVPRPGLFLSSCRSQKTTRNWVKSTGRYSSASSGASRCPRSSSSCWPTLVCWWGRPSTSRVDNGVQPSPPHSSLASLPVVSSARSGLCARLSSSWRLDWQRLLAAALWVGGMMYISTTYLPVILRSPVAERARSLVITLPYYSPWAVAAVVLMAVTGPFNATFHLTAWNQLITTACGRTLVVKILLVGALMLTSAIHVGLLRPRLKKEFKKYTYVQGRVPSSAGAEPSRAAKLITQQVKLREGRLTTGTRRLTGVLRWEPLLGVGVLICVGLMNAFAGTLSPVTPAQQQAPANTKPFNTTLKTSDNKFTITFNVNPNRFGTNMFTVSVVDNSTGKPTTNVGVSLYTKMLDMDMGTDTVNLLPDGKGHFSASGDLSMAGHWQIRIQIRTPNNTLHEAKVDFSVPS